MPSQTKTVTKADPPQLMPEGAPGYMQGTGFYQGQLAQPSVYGGERAIGPNPLQVGAVEQAGRTLGGFGGQGVEPGYSQIAKGEAARTMGGSWMTGPEAQTALTGMAQPLFERFENQIAPGIRDRTQMASGGAGGSRRTVANLNAIQELGQSYGSGVAAPVFSGERERMTRLATESPGAFTNADIARAAGMMQIGEQGRKLGEVGLQAQRDPYEEGLSRQAAAADALIGAATTGPGGSTAYYNPSVARMILGAGKA